MSQDVLIKVGNLYRYYGRLCAVQNVSFEMRRGEVLGFLGPNGAGKSTTMQIISGTLAPSAGLVEVAGHDLFEQPRAAKAALGYLPEQPPLYRELTVTEYLEFCGRLHGLKGNTLHLALRQVLEQCGLGDVRKRLIANLSKGYQQRVGIAQAVLHNPPVVILDEPTVGLDPNQIREIRHLIRSLGEDHSVLLSTHILSEVQAVCNRVQIINQGQLVLNDSIDGLFRRMHTTSLKLGLENPPGDEALLAVAGVEAVETLDDKYRRIQHSAQHNPAQALVEASVHQSWGLFELSPEQRSLEQVFMELTIEQDESGPDVPATQEAA